MRILFVTENIHEPPKSGGEIRDAEILLSFLEIASVDCLVFKAVFDEEPQFKGFGICNSVEYIDLQFTHANGFWKKTHRNTLGRLAQLLFCPFPYHYSGSLPRGLLKELKERIRTREYDLVWIQQTRLAFSLRLYGEKVALDGDDFDSVRFYQILQEEPWYGTKPLAYLDNFKIYLWELLLPSLFKIVVRCSVQDKLRINRSNVVVIPNGTYIPATVLRSNRGFKFLFIGLLGYEPNRLGVEWFLSEIWPLIRNALPDATIDIIGKNPSGKIAKEDGLNGVRVHGFVQDLKPFLCNACCSVVPLHSGGGTRLKILESLAFCTPVVSTHTGAFGVQIGEGEGLYRAESAEDFAAKCVWVAENSAAIEGICLKGRSIVSDKYDWNVIREQVKIQVLKICGR